MLAKISRFTAYTIQLKVKNRFSYMYLLYFLSTNAYEVNASNL
jgi:hypothetical protein